MRATRTAAVTALVLVLAAAHSWERANGPGQQREQALAPIDWKRVAEALGQPVAPQPARTYQAGVPMWLTRVSLTFLRATQGPSASAGLTVTLDTVTCRSLRGNPAL